MRRLTSILILLAALLSLSPAPASAWLFGSGDTLVTIDGTRYGKEDFKRWWQFWNDQKLPLPPTPDPYIDFLLLAREGERMELFATPDFQRQTRVFLTSRTLLMLKYDEVDSQIKLSPADIKAHYAAKYLPRWLVQRLEFRSDAEAKTAWDALSAKTVTVEQLLARSAEEGGPKSRNESWVRPSVIDPGWTAIFGKLAVGDVVNPADHEGGATLYHLKEQKGGDDEDFTKLQKEVERDLWKQREDELSLALLRGLYVKYQVGIDQERIDAIDINATDDALTDAFVITTTQQDIDEKQFMAVVRKLMNSRPGAAHAASDAAEAKKLKDETVGNILAQSLTNWEALDRHYEEKEPFKWEYQFNRQHRLTLELESLLFAPEAKVSDAEIKAYYEANLQRYSQPEMVKLFIVEETKGPIDLVWADVLVGKTFPAALKAHFEKTVSVQEVPANHLDPDVKAAVDKIAVGETSPIITTGGGRVLVHLSGRTPVTPFPLDRVTVSIRSKLAREKIERARQNYLGKIRSSSQIDVDKGQWQDIQKELGGA